jgi:hypothetical protein
MQFRKLQALAAVAATTAVAVPATEVSAATPKAGVYSGQTSQGNLMRIKVERTPSIRLRGRFVTPRRVQGKLDLPGRFSQCETRGISYHAIRR